MKTDSITRGILLHMPMPQITPMDRRRLPLSAMSKHGGTLVSKLRRIHTFRSKETAGLRRISSMGRENIHMKQDHGLGLRCPEVG